MFLQFVYLKMQWKASFGRSITLAMQTKKLKSKRYDKYRLGNCINTILEDQGAMMRIIKFVNFVTKSNYEGVVSIVSILL